jgi:DNA (cytosine-5)-methyltransferase 1
MKQTTNIYWIDLFAGAGGTSTGIHLAGQKVVACVNHDANAIAAHAANHPDTIHFTEDIRDFKVVEKLKVIVDSIREKDPKSIIAIWASLECTNFSKAKGGLPRDGDSRTLAEHMFMYLTELKPEYFWVENVREFMAWGPLDEDGKPISRNKGQDYLRWVNEISDLGFSFDFRLMNSANYGAYQSRERLFLQFATGDLPISWPEQTHTKDKRKDGLFFMEKWKAVKDVLDLNDHGKSIFERKKPLSENTLKRIYAGLEKFVAKGDTEFLKKYYSGRPAGKVISVDGPAGTIKTIDSHAIVSTTHLNTYYGNGGVHDINQPSPTLTTKDRIAKVDVVFIDQQYGTSKPASIDVPIGTLTSNPKFAIVKTESEVQPFLINANSSTSPPIDVENPSPSITQRTHLLINPGWGGNAGSVENPCCTVIARQDKAPLYLLSADSGPISLMVFEEDCETMVKIKKFMVAYNITDIKMRMLHVKELLRIQGFPEGYVLKGNQTEQKKQIGNAVEVYQSTAIAKAFNLAVQGYFEFVAA